MAMSGSTLAAAIKTKVQAKNPDFQANIGDSMDWLFEAVAEATVEHIQSSAVVSTTVNVTTASACSAGGAAGTGTGSGTGTVG